jgi:hypothetical protein
MAHPLSGARLKLDRANEHIRDLEAGLQRFARQNPYEVAETTNTAGDRVWVLKVRQEPPPRLSVVLGDAVHNLRAALDHLACAAVWRNRGEVTTSTAYPISDTAQRFERSLSRIAAAGEETLELIRASKPYKGGNDALWALHRLDIRDKHRLLLTVGGAYRSFGIDLGAMLAASAPEGFRSEGIPSMPVFIRPADKQFPLSGGEELYRIPANAEGAESHPTPQFRFDVVLGERDVFEGQPVLETIRRLADAVADVVEGFERLFAK